jgi:hypothetical protein
MRRLPPTRVEDNVNLLCDLCPEYADDLLGNVDQPLKILRDEDKGSSSGAITTETETRSGEWLRKLGTRNSSILRPISSIRGLRVRVYRDRY